jgi:hypothetical protein
MAVRNHQRSSWRLDLAGACKEFAQRNQEAVWQRNDFVFPWLADVDEVHWLASSQLTLQFAYRDLLHQGEPQTQLQIVAHNIIILNALFGTECPLTCASDVALRPPT